MRVTVRIAAQPSVRDGRADVKPFLDKVRRADEYGFDRISVGDTQLNNLEVVVALAAAATVTRRAELGPGVTNPVTRDIGVLANALASLDAVSGGRTFCLLGRGDGAVRNADLRPATVDETRAYLIALRRLLRDGEARLGERVIRLPWAARLTRPVPVYLVAEGPRMLRLGGELADGVFVGAGLLPEIVTETLSTIHEGARAADRDPAEVDIWWDTRSGVAPTHGAALERARESLASAGNHALRSGTTRHVPPELQERLTAYHERFDYAEKGTSSQNGPLMDDLGLTDYFIRRFGVVGTPDEVVDRLLELEALGVTQVSLATHDRGLTDITDSLTLLGEAVLPRLAGP